MNLTEEEMGLITQWHTISKKYRDTKDKRDSKEHQEAKAEMSAFRTYWRGIRDAVSTGAPGTASPASTKAVATTKGRSK